LFKQYSKKGLSKSYSVDCQRLKYLRALKLRMQEGLNIHISIQNQTDTFVFYLSFSAVMSSKASERKKWLQLTNEACR